MLTFNSCQDENVYLQYFLGLSLNNQLKEDQFKQGQRRKSDLRIFFYLTYFVFFTLPIFIDLEPVQRTINQGKGASRQIRSLDRKCTLR